MAVPGAIKNPQAMGCHHLLKQGAALVTSVDDVLNVVQFEPVKLLKPGVIPISKHEHLLQLMGNALTSVDQLMIQSGWSMEEVICELATLELEGVVQALSGGYMRCTL
jgi:DNA processing protein